MTRVSKLWAKKEILPRHEKAAAGSKGQDLFLSSIPFICQYLVAFSNFSLLMPHLCFTLKKMITNNINMIL